MRPPVRQTLFIFLLLSVCSALVHAQVFFVEEFSVDGDGTRYTMEGRGSDLSPDAWEHTFLALQSETFPLDPGGSFTLTANRIAIPWHSSFLNPGEQALSIFDSAVRWANAGEQLDVAFLGGLDNGDSLAHDRIVDMGHTVNRFEADAFTTSDLAATDLLVVSDSTSRNDLYRSFDIRGVDVPVVTWNALLADDLLLSKADAGSPQLRSIAVQSDTHPASPPGLTVGTTTALTSGDFQRFPNYGQPRPGVDVLATYQAPFARNVNSLAVVDAMVAGDAGSFSGMSTETSANLHDSGAGAFGIWTDSSPDWPIPLPDAPGFTQQPGTLNDFGVVSRGTIVVSEPGDYVFGIGGDDGGRLRINGEDVVIDDGIHAFRYQTGQVTLPAGEHEVEWTMFDRSQGAGFEVSWIRAADFDAAANPADVFAGSGDLLSVDPVDTSLVVKQPGLEFTSYFLDPLGGPEVPTNDPAILAAVGRNHHPCSH